MVLVLPSGKLLQRRTPPLVVGGGGSAYTTLDPATKGAGITLDATKLQMGLSSGQYGVRSLASFGAVKRHCEVTFVNGIGADGSIGVGDGSWDTGSGTYLGNGHSAGFYLDGRYGIGIGNTSDPILAVGETWGLEFDGATGVLDLATPRNGFGFAPFNISVVTTPPTAPFYFLAECNDTAANWLWNFGDSPWVYTPSSGYTGLA